MTTDLIVPEVGESISEVEIGEWLIQEGDSIQQDDIVVMIETDKVTVELPAPITGKLTRIIKKPGDTASVGDIIGSIEAGEVTLKDTQPKANPQPANETTQQTEKTIMPAAQRAAAQHGIDAEKTKGTGPGGRVLKEDIMKQIAHQTKAIATTDRREEVVPMSPLRRKLAQHLVQAQQNAALLTTFNEVDMTCVKKLRAEQKEAFLQKHGVKLGFMSFFVKAAIDALKQTPQLNASIQGNDITYRHYYDIGIAVGGGRGLVVPVIRDAQMLSFSEIEKTIADFGNRAQTNKIKLEELQGGTFTISNGGVYGSLMSTPIINPPQSGILGLHGIQDRPAAVGGKVEVRPLMYIALTYDHRIVDGREAVTFLKRIKECIENPTRMLLEI